MKIDLHVHTRERSSCALASADEQIRAAIAARLDAIVITDHARLVPRAQMDMLNQRYAPFQVFGGIEVTTEDEDVLVLGVQDASLERPGWTYADLHTLVGTQHGFIALAHPFRYRASIGLDLDRYPLDAVEVYSSNTPVAAEEAIRTIATRFRLALLSNSDAHTAGEIGTHYNLLPCWARNERELIAALRSQPLTCIGRKGLRGL